MNENTVNAIGWFCAAIVLCTAISGITYYNVVKPNRMEIVERMVRENGIHPMVFECMQRDWSRAGNFEVCNSVVKQLKLTPEQEERFQSLLDSERPQ